MTHEDTAWFLPFDANPPILQSAYAAAPATPPAEAEITTGSPFTVSLVAVRLAPRPQEPWVQRLLHPNNDVLILTSATLGSQPIVERLHYYASDITLGQPLVAHDLLANGIWVCADYQAPDTMYIELSVVTMDGLDEQATSALHAFDTCATTCGAIFPAALPYFGLGEGLLKGLGALWQRFERHESYSLVEPLQLFAPGTPDAKTLRVGHYVLLSEPIDGSQYVLEDGGHVVTAQGSEPTGASGHPLSYAVLRIDPVDCVEPDHLVSQQAAALLTQFHTDHDGHPSGGMTTAFDALTDTLTAATQFTQLQRYQELVRKGEQRTAAETTLMQQIARRPELQPFLPHAA